MKYKTILSLILSASFSVFLFTGSTGKPSERGSDSQAEAVTPSSDVSVTDDEPVAETTAVTTVTTSTATAVVTTTTQPDPPADLVLQGHDTVEVCTDMTIEDFITERNVELKDGSALLDTSETGDYEIEVPYLYEGTEFSQTLRYCVADTTKPLIINPGKNTKHKVHTESQQFQLLPVLADIQNQLYWYVKLSVHIPI